MSGNKSGAIYENKAAEIDLQEVHYEDLDGKTCKPQDEEFSTEKEGKIQVPLKALVVAIIIAIILCIVICIVVVAIGFALTKQEGKIYFNCTIYFEI